MSVTFLDNSDDILSGNEHWSKLDEAWGTPVDLETEDLESSPNSQQPTSDSKQKKRKYHESFSPIDPSKQKNNSFVKKAQLSALDYSDFIQELDTKDQDCEKDFKKQFYFVGGQIFSAASVNEICEDIDNLFKSVEKLCASTSTIRERKKAKSVPKIPEVVECSFNTSDLSFDETVESEKEKSDSDNVDCFIDELFNELDRTLVSFCAQKSVADSTELLNQSCKESVTTLVRKFSCVLGTPGVKCSPRRKRECSDRFRNLAQFWKARASEV